jgi:hypothetical protein
MERITFPFSSLGVVDMFLVLVFVFLDSCAKASCNAVQLP